jgi:hypothetical protein
MDPRKVSPLQVGPREVGALEVRFPEVGASQIYCDKVQASSCRLILLARRLITAPEHCEDGLNVGRRPNLNAARLCSLTEEGF